MTLSSPVAATHVPFTDETGLRDYRVGVAAAGDRAARWPWPCLVVIAFLIGLALGTKLHAAERCITIHVRPQVMLQRAPIDVQTRIPRHPDHRAYLVAWNSDTGSEGSSGPHPLQGDQDRTLFDLTLPDQPPGHYVFAASVFDASGRVVGRDQAEIRTIDPDPGQP